jgi:hypothetical protein
MTKKSWVTRKLYRKKFMNTKEWVVVYTADGKLAAEIIQLTLESFGIPAILEQESLGRVYGLTIGPLGETQILVHPSKAAEADEILRNMESGNLEVPENDGVAKDLNKDGDSNLTK